MQVASSNRAALICAPGKKLIFNGKASLYFYHLDKQDYVKLASGEARILLYGDDTKAMVSFLKSPEATENPEYCADNTLLNGHIHEAVTVKNHSPDGRAILFGKIPSFDYKDSDGNLIKTFWSVKFEKGEIGVKTAAVFKNLLMHLVSVEALRRSGVKAMKPLRGNGTTRTIVEESEEDVDGDDTKPSGEDNLVDSMSKAKVGTDDDGGADSTEDDDDFVSYEIAASQSICVLRDPFANNDDDNGEAES